MQYLVTDKYLLRSGDNILPEIVCELPCIQQKQTFYTTRDYNPFVSKISESIDQANGESVTMFISADLIYFTGLVDCIQRAISIPIEIHSCLDSLITQKNLPTGEYALLNLSARQCSIITVAIADNYYDIINFRPIPIDEVQELFCESFDADKPNLFCDFSDYQQVLDAAKYTHNNILDKHEPQYFTTYDIPLGSIWEGDFQTLSNNTCIFLQTLAKRHSAAGQNTIVLSSLLLNPYVRKALKSKEASYHCETDFITQSLTVFACSRVSSEYQVHCFPTLITSENPSLWLLAQLHDSISIVYKNNTKSKNYQFKLEEINTEIAETSFALGNSTVVKFKLEVRTNLFSNPEAYITDLRNEQFYLQLTNEYDR